MSITFAVCTILLQDVHCFMSPRGIRELLGPWLVVLWHEEVHTLPSRCDLVQGFPFDLRAELRLRSLEVLPDQDRKGLDASVNLMCNAPCRDLVILELLE